MNHEAVGAKAYFPVYVGLLVLLLVTVGANYVHFGDVANVIVAMAIASTKAVLILLYFMHVRVSGKLILFFFVAAVYLLAIGGLLAMSDYVSR